MVDLSVSPGLNNPCLRPLTDNKKTDVEVLLGDCSITELHGLRGELVDSGKSTR